MNGHVVPMLLLALLVPILTCCTTTGSGGTEAASSPAAVLRTCEAWPNIAWSSRDTPETIKDAKANNAPRRAFCQ